MEMSLLHGWLQHQQTVALHNKSHHSFACCSTANSPLFQADCIPNWNTSPLHYGCRAGYLAQHLWLMGTNISHISLLYTEGLWEYDSQLSSPNKALQAICLSSTVWGCLLLLLDFLSFTNCLSKLEEMVLGSSDAVAICLAEISCRPVKNPTLIYLCINNMTDHHPTPTSQKRTRSCFNHPCE